MLGVAPPDPVRLDIGGCDILERLAAHHVELRAGSPFGFGHRPFGQGVAAILGGPMQFSRVLAGFRKGDGPKFRSGAAQTHFAGLGILAGQLEAENPEPCASIAHQ